ncbi:hypothetical protein HO173_011443 [Letharia columbiana]|uniref:Uncharacterized protein n=1 Tax=Letharia columbiana TaxID=112416 RepID=A0A8H6KZ47_9LECA|nr:uncharacterized protein HO173_011443 [Letharia columbiana]KAF6229588.1 hypothetical protein HO173_011443 [Letharia columbiana]
MATTSIITPPSSSSPSNSTAPSTPPCITSLVVNATNPSQGCTSPFCPINYPHDRGPYLHSCRVALSIESRRIFASSVPSPDVLAAYERCIRNDGTRTDAEMWMTFHELHVEPLLGHTDAIWVAPVPMESRDDDSDVGERAGPGGIVANGAAEGCRHPFGLLNPPEKVWEAHRRLVLGDGDSEDQDLVASFAAENAYYGNGLGRQKSMSRRFKVRRPRYSPSLSKQRRNKKEMESK